MAYYISNYDSRRRDYVVYEGSYRKQQGKDYYDCYTNNNMVFCSDGVDNLSWFACNERPVRINKEEYDIFVKESSKIQSMRNMFKTTAMAMYLQKRSI